MSAYREYLKGRNRRIAASCVVVLVVAVWAMPTFGAEVLGSIELHLRATDMPNDDGSSILLVWDEQPVDGPELEYVVFVAQSAKGPYREVARFGANQRYCRDADSIFGFFASRRKGHYYLFLPLRAFPAKKKDERKRVRRATYWFRLGLAAKGKKPSVLSEPVSAAAKENWFDFRKLNNFIFMLLYSGTVLGFIQLARRNPHIFLRKISGLDAIEEAVGRSTEMGRPVLFVHGLAGMDAVSTIAAVNILGRVARRVAEYDTSLIVANNDPIVFSVSQEVVREAYTEAGRPDAYQPDNVRMVASAQFPYVTAVSGIMLRERPATNLFMGYFYAESLILAETGAATGAIQIAGTDAYTQLPFFITTCDYTLMGEELYAASAYLSREPLLVGSLRGQDAGKAFFGIALLVASVLSSLKLDVVRELFRVF